VYAAATWTQYLWTPCEVAVTSNSTGTPLHDRDVPRRRHGVGLLCSGALRAGDEPQGRLL